MRIGKILIVALALIFIPFAFIPSTNCAQEFYSERLVITVEQTGEVTVCGVFEGKDISFPLVPNELPPEIEKLRFEIDTDVTLKVCYYEMDLNATEMAAFLEFIEIISDIVAEAASEKLGVEFINTTPIGRCFVYTASTKPNFSSYIPSKDGFAKTSVLNNITLLETRRSGGGWINSVTLINNLGTIFEGSGEHTLDILDLLEIQTLERSLDSAFSVFTVVFNPDNFSFIESTPGLGKNYTSYPFPAYFDDVDSNTYSLVFGEDFSSKNNVSITFSATFPGNGTSTDSIDGNFLIYVILGIIFVGIYSHLKSSRKNEHNYSLKSSTTTILGRKKEKIGTIIRKKGKYF